MEKYLALLLITPLCLMVHPFSTHHPPCLPCINVSRNQLCQIMVYQASSTGTSGVALGQLGELAFLTMTLE